MDLTRYEMASMENIKEASNEIEMNFRSDQDVYANNQNLTGITFCCSFGTPLSLIYFTAVPQITEGIRQIYIQQSNAETLIKFFVHENPSALSAEHMSLATKRLIIFTIVQDSLIRGTFTEYLDYVQTRKQFHASNVSRAFFQTTENENKFPAKSAIQLKMKLKFYAKIEDTNICQLIYGKSKQSKRKRVDNKMRCGIEVILEDNNEKAGKDEKALYG